MTRPLYPSWLQPLAHTLDRTSISRMGGLKRQALMSDEERTQLGRNGSRAALKAKTPEQRKLYAQRALEASLRVRAERRAAGNPVRPSHTKLNNEKAADIRRRIAAGEKQDYVAAVYGVSPTLICRVKRGERWAQSGQ